MTTITLHPVRRPWRAWLLAGLLAIGLAGGAVAQGSCTIPQPGDHAAIADFDLKLARLKLRDCLGDRANDPAALVQGFNALTNEPTLLGQTERLLQAMDLLIADAERHEATNVLKPRWTPMLEDLRAVRAELAGTLDVKTGAGWLSAMEKAIGPKWRQVSSGQPIVLVGQSVDLLANAGCANDQPPCEAFFSQMDIVRTANLMDRLRGYSQSPLLAQQYDESQLALKRWDAYRTQGQHQYIWEVFINGQVMDGDQSLCPRDAGTGMKMGFCKVPESQWIVAHPEAGLRWSDGAEQRSDLQAALVIQLIGRYQWKWDGSTMANRRGYSLAATYSQSDTNKRWAFGPMIHYDDMSLALTKAPGGHWGLVVNVALADRFFGRKQEVTDALRNVRKASFGELLFGR
ncbi:MAG: hypothetical protein U1F53_08305 [Burkholderiaceae bacterium]